MKSTDVINIYDKNYFLKAVDGYKEFSKFDGSFNKLFERYQRNIKLLELKKNHAYLEVGCGRGEICIHHAITGGNAKGIDFSEDAINLAKLKAKELGLSSSAVTFETIPFQCIIDSSESYDRILASEFIEHISKSEASEFMKIAHNLLKTNGKLLIFTHPNTLQRKYGYPILRALSLLRGVRLPKIQDDMQGDHYRMYHLNEQNFLSLNDLAKNAGFKNIKVGYDVGYNSSGLKKALIHLISITPMKHILMVNLFLVAEK